MAIQKPVKDILLAQRTSRMGADTRRSADLVLTSKTKTLGQERRQIWMGDSKKLLFPRCTQDGSRWSQDGPR